MSELIRLPFPQWVPLLSGNISICDDPQGSFAGSWVIFAKFSLLSAGPGQCCTQKGLHVLLLSDLKDFRDAVSPNGKPQ